MGPETPITPPISRLQILALLQPVISVVSGALAAWLFVHVHILGIFHVAQSQVATDIASGIVFLVTAGLTWLSQHENLIPITNAVNASRIGVVPPPVLPFSVAEIIAFLSPYISVAAGALASWLFVHVHVLGIFHVGEQGVASAVASAIVFAVTAVLTWAANTLHLLPALRAKHQPTPAASARI